MNKVAIYPGSFDPITFGHLDIIERSTHMFDKVIVGIVANPNKEPSFTVSTRRLMIENAVHDLKTGLHYQKIIVEVKAFSGLLVDFVKQQKATTIIKGLRAITDFEYEFQMAHLNKQLDESVETVFMMSDPKYTFLSSSAVKEIVILGGDVSSLVPRTTKEWLKNRFPEKRRNI